MPLVVIEGIDGAGTTTQADLLAHTYRVADLDAQITTHNSAARKYRDVLCSCSPSNGPFGKIVRSVFEKRLEGVSELPNWRTMFYLFQADLEYQQAGIKNAIENGSLYILDRYWLSSMTYQVAQAMAEGESKEEASYLIREVNELSVVPDATIILDVSVEEGLRRKKKSPDFFEKQEFLEKVRQLYLEVRGAGVRHVSTENKTAEESHEEIHGILLEMGI